MTEPIEAKAEFHSLAEDAVVAALQNPNPANPIAVEVARLIAAYTNNSKRHVIGPRPPELLHIKPRWPIEAVAMPPDHDVDPRNPRPAHQRKAKARPRHHEPVALSVTAPNAADVGLVSGMANIRRSVIK